MAVREAAGIFDVSHMGEIETSGPQALELLQRLLSNDVSKIPPGGAQYSVLCREDGGVLDDLFTYRLEVDRYLTVTNAANHVADLAWFESVAADFPEARVSDRIDDWAMMAVQGPLAREIVQAGADGPLPDRMTHGPRRISGEEVLVCGTGYTGEDGVELLCSPEHAPRLWSAARAPRRTPGRARRARHAAPGGVLPPLRQRAWRRARADRGGARLVLQGGDGVHRGGRGPSRARGGPGREARRVRDRRAGDRAPGQHRGGRGRGDERHALAVPGARHRHGVCPRRARRGRDAARDRRARARPPGHGRREAVRRRSAPEAAGASRSAQDRARRSWQDCARRTLSRPTQKGLREWPRPAIPTTSSTTPSTTGPASRAPTRRRSASPGSRRTRSARSSSSSRPRSGTAVTKDAAYTEVESVKAVSDVIAPLSGEVDRRQRGAAGQPGADQRGPLRRGLAREGAPVGSVRARGADGRRGLSGHPRWLSGRRPGGRVARLRAT